MALLLVLLSSRFNGNRPSPLLSPARSIGRSQVSGFPSKPISPLPSPLSIPSLDDQAPSPSPISTSFWRSSSMRLDRIWCIPSQWISNLRMRRYLTVLTWYCYRAWVAVSRGLLLGLLLGYQVNIINNELTSSWTSTY
jgi:hypothetical protein